ncbi:hypothetical protein IWQ61_008645 [Dispira simplex]|nr:hypothetical protein IWQ61_008645 [Dispira simplex]
MLSSRLGTTTGSSDSRFTTLEALNDPTPPPIVSLGSPFGVSPSPRPIHGIHTAGTFTPWRSNSSPLRSVAFQDSLRKLAKRSRGYSSDVFTTHHSPGYSSPSVGSTTTGTSAVGLSYTQPSWSDNSNRGPDPEDFNRWAKRLRARINQAIHPVDRTSPRTASRLSTIQPSLHSAIPQTSHQGTTLNGDNSTYILTRTSMVHSELPTGPGVHSQLHPTTGACNGSYPFTRSSKSSSTERYYDGKSSDKYMGSSPIHSDQSIVILSSDDEEVEDEKVQTLLSATPSPILLSHASDVLVESDRSKEYTGSSADNQSEEEEEQQLCVHKYEDDQDDVGLMVKDIGPFTALFVDEQLSPSSVSYSTSDASDNNLADTVVSLSSDTSSVASSASDFDSSGPLQGTQSSEGTADSTLMEKEYTSSDSSSLSHDFHGLVRASSQEVSSRVSSRVSSPDSGARVGLGAIFDASPLSGQSHASPRPLVNSSTQPVSYRHTTTTALSPLTTTTSGHPLEQTDSYESLYVSQRTPVRTRRLSLTSVTSTSSRVSCHCSSMDHPDGAVHSHGTSPYFLRSQCRSKTCVLRDTHDKDTETSKAKGKSKVTDTPVPVTSQVHHPPSVPSRLPLEGAIEWDSPPATNTRNKCHQRTMAATISTFNPRQRKQRLSQQVIPAREPYELRSRSCSASLPRPTVRDTGVMPPPKFPLTVSHTKQPRPRALSSPTRSMGNTTASSTG